MSIAENLHAYLVYIIPTNIAFKTDQFAHYIVRNIKVHKGTISMFQSDKVCNSQQRKRRTIKSNLRTSIYCKISLAVYMAQDELRNKKNRNSPQ